MFKIQNEAIVRCLYFQGHMLLHGDILSIVLF